MPSGDYVRQARAARSAGKTQFAIAGVIPEEIQAPMRRRLRMMRVSKGISQHGFKTIGNISTAENHDISTVKVGVLYLLATELGEDFVEFMRYLMGETSEFDPERVTDEKVFRLNVLMRSLDERDQEIVLDLVRVIAGARPRPTDVERSASISKGASESEVKRAGNRKAKDVLAEHAAS